jgi:hypothetical protein
VSRQKEQEHFLWEHFLEYILACIYFSFILIKGVTADW